MTIKQQIERDLGMFVSPSSVTGVDYQCNACFALAKQLGKKPLDVANEVASKFKSDVATVSVSSPAFLNFTVKDEVLLRIKGVELQKQPKQKVFFDYGGANIAKELHVGHLRSPIVGEALKRVWEAFGHETVACTYLGDWGLQIGLVIAQCIDDKTVVNGKFVSEITLDLLNDIYPKASKRKDAEPQFKKNAEDITVRLQSLQEPYISLWREIRRVSVDKIRENYERLGCTFDFYNGESNAEPFVEVVLEGLKAAGLTYVDKDCLMIDVREEGEHVPIPKKTPDEPQRFERPMPPVILKKGNGGDLYSTSDVATIYSRNKEHQPSEFVYVTDFRQEMHFTQVFRIVKKGGIVPKTTKMTHVGYGAMLGQDGKPFKTRAGGTIRLGEVIGLVTDAAKKRIEESGRGVDANVAEKVGLSALKFADLSNNVRRDYIFDIDKFTSFEGKTGPYMLYTVARINSVLEKSGLDTNGRWSIAPTQCEITDEIRAIYMGVVRLGDAYVVAQQNYTLNGIVDAVYELAKAFNLFYASTNILKETNEETRNFYLGVCVLVRDSIGFALDTLAIETVEKM